MTFSKGAGFDKISLEFDLEMGAHFDKENIRKDRNAHMFYN